MELSTNSSGYKVSAIQRFLASRGHLEEGEVDGEYGTETREAVRIFQFKNALRADGIAGPSTLRIMGSKGLQLAPWIESDLTDAFIGRLENFVERVLEEVESIEEERYFDYSGEKFEETSEANYLTKRTKELDEPHYAATSRREELSKSFRPHVVAEISKMHKEIYYAEWIGYAKIRVTYKSRIGLEGMTKILSEIEKEVDKEFGFSD